LVGDKAPEARRDALLIGGYIFVIFDIVDTYVKKRFVDGGSTIRTIDIASLV